MLQSLLDAWHALLEIHDIRWYFGVGWAIYIVGLGGWIVLQKREPVATLSWLFGLALLPYVGFIVYWWLGPQRIKRHRLRRMRSRTDRLPAQGEDIIARELSRLGTATTGLPATTVWGSGAVASRSKNGLLLHNAPSLTLEAQYNSPVRVKWINDLKDADGNFRPHLLPVDPTLRWANPPGGTAGRDTRPTFTATPGPYTGPIPIVTHVHGAVGVGDESDGYAEAWYLPAAGNIPAGHATQGTWYDFFKGKAAGKFGVT